MQVSSPEVVRQVRWEKFPPSSEDLWLAQEDLWVQWELLKCLREAIFYTAQFNLVEPGKPDKTKGVIYLQPSGTRTGRWT